MRIIKTVGFFYTGVDSSFAGCWLLGFILYSISLFICSIEIVWFPTSVLVSEQTSNPYNTTVDNHLKAKPSKKQASQIWRYLSSFCPMRSWTSLNQPLQFVYTPKPHMSFSSPSQQRSQRCLPSWWLTSVPASDHRTINP